MYRQGHVNPREAQSRAKRTAELLRPRMRARHEQSQVQGKKCVRCRGGYSSKGEGKGEGCRVQTIKGLYGAAALLMHSSSRQGCCKVRQTRHPVDWVMAACFSRGSSPSSLSLRAGARTGGGGQVSRACEAADAVMHSVMHATAEVARSRGACSCTGAHRPCSAALETEPHCCSDGASPASSMSSEMSDVDLWARAFSTLLGSLATRVCEAQSGQLT